MKAPSKLYMKYLSRFGELIGEGQNLLQEVQKIPESTVATTAERIPSLTARQEQILYGDVQAWEIKYRSLLDQVLPKKSVHRDLLKPGSFYDKKSRLRAPRKIARAISI
jgi:hypothetical protein